MQTYEPKLKTDILITEELDSPAVRRLAEHYVVAAESVLWKDASQLRARLSETRVVMIRNQTRLTRELIEAAPGLLAIGRVGVGLDNIDLDAAHECGVVVIAPLEANAVSVAELTLGLLLALARKIPQADRSTKTGHWDRRGCTGMEIDGKTLLLCGYGRIGRLVAARARAFGLRVMVYDPFVQADAPELRETGATLVMSLPEALAEADFVSAHLPLTPKTGHLFNAQTFAAMKPGAFTVEAQTRTFKAVCGDLDRVLRGEPAVSFVNFARPVRST